MTARKFDIYFKNAFKIVLTARSHRSYLVGLKSRDIKDKIRLKCKKKSYQSQSEIVVKVVGLMCSGFSEGIGRMDFHFIFGLVKCPRRSSNGRNDILDRISEKYIAR